MILMIWPQSRSTSRTKRSKLLSQIFWNHRIEELAAGHFGRGDESSDAGTAPRRNDFDVQPRLRPFVTVRRTLVDPHHVGQRLVVQAVEPMEDVDQALGQRLAPGLV